MRCAIYARVSTELDTQRTSIDNQIDLFNNYVMERGWEVVKIYQDKQSGTKENRPGLKALIEDAKAGMFDVIMAKELSRLARNGRLSYELRDICQFNNIHIICLDNSINTIEGNHQNFGLFAWLYETESANSSRRNKQAKIAKARRGKFSGSTPPYGYICEDGVLKVRNDNTPNIVRRIFNEYLSGEGMHTIAKTLTAERVPTPAQAANKSNASSTWHESTVKKILNNYHYCGNLVQNRTETITVTSSKRRIVSPEDLIVVERTHEAIIPKEMFTAVQQMIQRRSRNATAPKKHLFTNLFYCEECQRGMWYKKNQRGYRCGGNIKHGDIFCTNRKPIREKELAGIILEDLRYLFRTLEEESFVNQLLRKLNKQKQRITQELKGLEDKITSLRAKKLDYVHLFTEGIISREELKEYRSTADNLIRNVTVEMEQLHKQLQDCAEENYAINLRDKLKDVLTIKEITPQLLHSLVNRIECKSDGTVTIHYTFVNPFQDM